MQDPREFGHGKRGLGEASQCGAATCRSASEHIAERLVEFPEKRAVRHEAELPCILLHRPFGMNLLKVLRHSAGDGQDVEELPRRQPLSGEPEHRHALGQRHLADVKVKRVPANEPRAVENVFGYPRRNRAAENKYQIVVLLQPLVPGRLQIPGEIGIARAHPGNLVKQDDRASAGGNRRIKAPERLRPVPGGRDGLSRLVGKFVAEVLPLGEVGHALARRNPHDVYETVRRERAKLFEQRERPVRKSRFVEDTTAETLTERFRKQEPEVDSTTVRASQFC